MSFMALTYLSKGVEMHLAPRSTPSHWRSGTSALNTEMPDFLSCH